LWIPFLVILSVTYVTSDSDNNAASLVTRSLIPAIVLWLGSKLALVESKANEKDIPQYTEEG